MPAEQPSPRSKLHLAGSTDAPAAPSKSSLQTRFQVIGVGGGVVVVVSVGGGVTPPPPPAPPQATTLVRANRATVWSAIRRRDVTQRVATWADGRSRRPACERILSIR